MTINYNELEKIYAYYQKNIRKLLILIESQIEEYPEIILKRIRNHNDLVALRTIKSLSMKERGENFSKIKQNIDLGAIDCYRILCTQPNIRWKQFRKDYNGLNLKDVDDGEFWKECSRLLKKAQKSLKIARTLERKKIKRDISSKIIKLKDAEDLSGIIDSYVDAYNNQVDIFKFIEKQGENLEKAVMIFSSKTFTWKHQLISLLVVLFTGIVGTFLILLFLR